MGAHEDPNTRVMGPAWLVLPWSGCGVCSSTDRGQEGLTQTGPVWVVLGQFSLWDIHRNITWGSQRAEQLWALHGLTHMKPIWVFCGINGFSLPTLNPYLGCPRGHVCLDS